MKKYYADIIPSYVAEKLKEKGKNIPTIAKYIIGNQVREYDKDYDDDMPIIGKREYHDGDLITFDRIDKECNPVCCNAPTYAEVFDWLISENDTEISFEPNFQSAIIAGTVETSRQYYTAYISRQRGGFICCVFGDTWHEAANAAIEKVLTMN